MTKDYLRRVLRRMRRELSDNQRAAAAQGVFEQFRHQGVFVRAQTIAGYAGTRGEVSLRPLHAVSGATWAFPRTDPDAHRLTWHVCEEWPQEIGHYGIPEPPADAPQIDPSEIDLWLIPAVATDRTGARLGQGGGYYDAVLAQVRAPVVAVVHDFQHRFELPMEPHDQYVDYVLTPEGLHHYRVRERALR